MRDYLHVLLNNKFFKPSSFRFLSEGMPERPKGQDLSRMENQGFP